jgi:hypothetical protein
MIKKSRRPSSPQFKCIHFTTLKLKTSQKFQVKLRECNRAELVMQRGIYSSIQQRLGIYPQYSIFGIWELAVLMTNKNMQDPRLETL